MPIFAFKWIILVVVLVVALLVTLGLAVFGLLAGKRKTAVLVVIAVVAGAMLAMSFLGLRAMTGAVYAPSMMWRGIGAILVLGLLVCVLVSVMSLIWRFFAWLGNADPAGAAVNPEERKRILSMVEQGKMTGVEGAELLDALGKSSALRGQQTFGRLDVALLVALAVVVLGFFLPWYYIGYRMWQTGYQVGAIGWAVLISAILAALLVFITPKEYLYKLVLLQLLAICVGLALMTSVWWSAWSNVAAGTVICFLGFGFALVASGMKLKALGR